VSGGGILATGNHPGRARTAEEVRADLAKSMSLIPGISRVNVHSYYAEFDDGKYEQAEQLPKPSAEVSVLTGQHLRIVDLPEKLGRKLLRADIFRKTADGWSKDRWATAENPIVGRRKMWQSMVVSVAPRESARAKTLEPNQPLPAGQYLVKIYVDRHDKLKKNRDAELGAADLYGTVQNRGEWRVGYQPPKIVHAPVKD
ncbi:MAG: L-rhamnose isomerase, partial [Pirellulaceae bacterium]